MAIGLWPLSAGIGNTISLSFETFAGMKHGVVSELVYKTDGENYLSRLDWEQKPSIYLGGGVQARFGRFRLHTSMQVALPMIGGGMYDYDWLMSDPNASFSHYSEHNVFVERDTVFAASLGFDFISLSWLRVGPLVGVVYQNRAWTALDGYAQYPSDPSYHDEWTSDRAKKHFIGKIVSYEQTLLYPQLGLSFSLSPVEKMWVIAEGSYAPFLQIEAEDHHYLNSYRYRDILTAGKIWQTSCSVLLEDPSFLHARSARVTVGYGETQATGEAYGAAMNSSSWYLLAASGTKASLFYIEFGLTI